MSDGIPNLLKFAMGRPLTATSYEFATQHGIVNISGNTHLIFTFRRLAGTGIGSTENGYSAAGITHFVETSSTLLPWSW